MTELNEKTGKREKRTLGLKEQLALEAGKTLLNSTSAALKVCMTVIMALAFVAIGLYAFRSPLKEAYDYMFDRHAEIGHIMLSDIAKTDKLTVISMYKEAIVGQHRQEKGRLFGTNEYQIYAVYPGRIDVGFDLTRCAPDWLQMRGDTAFVKLPAVSILNSDGWYLDEAAHTTPIEDGVWTTAEYGMLAQRANALIKRNCELDNCYRRAETQGVKVVENLLHAMGIKHVMVDVQLRQQYKPFAIEAEPAAGAKEKFKFYTSVSRNDYVGFDDGAALFYKGDISSENLYSLIDMFRYFTKGQPSHFWTAFQRGDYFSLSIMNMGLTKGTDAANAFARKCAANDVSRLATALQQMLGEGARVSISETDRHGQVLHRYQ